MLLNKKSAGLDIEKGRKMTENVVHKYVRRMIMEYKINYKHWEQENFLQLFTILQNHPNTKLVLYLDESQDKREDDLGKIVGNYLNVLGISRHLKGYGYLKYGILSCINHPEAMESITKILYPKIASFHHTTSGKVEHGIRHAIKKAWEGEKSEEWEVIFGKGYLNKNIKPTNAGFIAAVSDYISINN